VVTSASKGFLRRGNDWPNEMDTVRAEVVREPRAKPSGGDARDEGCTNVEPAQADGDVRWAAARVTDKAEIAPGVLRASGVWENVHDDLADDGNRNGLVPMFCFAGHAARERPGKQAITTSARRRRVTKPTPAGRLP
jgi:hypothetical protein